MDELVSINAVIDKFGIPRTTLYRLVKSKLVRAYPQPLQVYQRRRRLLFRLSEVEADLAALPKPRPPEKPQ